MRPTPITHGLRACLRTFALWAGATAPLLAGDLSRVSVDSGGVEGLADSFSAAISADGRVVAFASFSANLIAPGLDVNTAVDVFVHERETGVTTRVSVATGGAPGNADSIMPALSADGRFVAFESDASTLVDGDLNGTRDIFVRDRLNHTTERVSVASGGAQVFSDCFAPDISADGRFVVFWSFSPDLVPPDGEGHADVFLHDRDTNTTVRVSQTPGGVLGDANSQFPAISGDGRFVAFHSTVTNLVPGDASIQDVLVWERETLAHELASLSSSRVGGNSSSWYPDLSFDGSHVVFESFATNLVDDDQNLVRDVFLRDRAAGTTERISLRFDEDEGDNFSRDASVSDDGRFVAFRSNAENLVDGDSNKWADIFVRDRALGATTRLTLGPGSVQSNHMSELPAISGSGRYVAFESLATNLASDDGNIAEDVFVLDQRFPTGYAFCFGDGSGADCPCGNTGGSRRGCENSFGTGGALLGARGAASVAADSVVLVATGLPPSTIVLFFQGITPTGGGAGVAFGDGLLCVGGDVIRLAGVPAAGGLAALGAGLPGPLISLQGAIPSRGATRLYQGWYRNNAPFCTAAPFNLTNALQIDWLP